MAKYPDKPKELWMLWNPTMEIWGLAQDDPDPETAYLCALTKRAAKALAKHEKELFEIKLIPVRVI